MFRRIGYGIVLSLGLALPVQSVNADGVYEPRNIEVNNGNIQLAKSGEQIFFTDFSDQNLTPNVGNYRDLLEIKFGETLDNASALVVTKAKEIDPNDSEGHDTAWEVATDRLPLDSKYRGVDYVLRFSTVASKAIRGGDSSGYRGKITWFDSEGKELESSDSLYCAECQVIERSISGTIPTDAAFFEIRQGFDIPNLLPDEFAAIRYCSLEAIDSQQPCVASGEYVSDVFVGGAVSWDADVPEGGAIKFQISTAEKVDGIISDFSPFVGPDGTAASYYDAPFEASADFFRYKAVLVPNSGVSPLLRSISIGDFVEKSWKLCADLNPPRVRLAGARAVPNPDPSAPVQIDITDDSLIMNAISVTVDDSETPSEYDVDLSERGHTILTVKSDPFTEGLHKVVVSTSDVHRNKVVATRYFLVGEQANAINVTMREEDGATLIDGEPFFPIGIYGVVEREFNGNNIDEAFRGLKEAGFNFAHSYAIPREDKFLAAAEKYGFKLWTVARFPDERFVEVERFSPAIIAWYLGDDTSANTVPSKLYDYHDSVKAVDPTRLTVQADPIGARQEISNYRPYVEGTDAFLPEIYPVMHDERNDGEHCVAQTVLDMKCSRQDAIDAGDGPKSIWPIIQYFQGWGWERFPTYRELRAMSFASIAAGANGITWYTYGGTVEPEKKKFNYGVTTSPERWQNISTVATQIKELCPALLTVSDPSLQPKATITSGAQLDCFGNPTATTLLKELDGVKYLLVVNSSTEPIDVQFESPAFDGSKRLESVFEEDAVSTPEMKDGILTDNIEGFGVRVYRW